ncbi:carbonic anhydrase 13-like [Lissotriton helveticus]
MARSWGYAEHNGPSHWHTLFPVADGDYQSPIDIRTKEATYYDATLKPLTIHYEPSSAQKLHNNGQSFNVEFDDSQDKSVLTGGPLPGVYRLRQMHIHWGSADGHGSEHTVDGRTHSAELHLVHWNAKYGSFDEALKNKDGVGVIALFLEVGEANPGLQKVIDALGLIPNKGKEIHFTNYDPSILLPNSLDYWTYQGSLTTPPLLESIIWILLRAPITVSAEQMAKLRALYFNTEKETPCHMMNNYRPPQPLKGRKVRASFQ